MPAWVTITTESLTDYCVPSIVNSMLDVCRTQGDPDPFGGLMRGVVSSIRGRIAACDEYRLSNNDLEIPPEFEALACLRILVLLQGRVPSDNQGGSFQLSEDQRTLLEHLEDDLTDASLCKFAVTTPDNPQPARELQTGSNSPAFGERRRLRPGPDLGPRRDPRAFDDSFDEGFA